MYEKSLLLSNLMLSLGFRTLSVLYFLYGDNMDNSVKYNIDTENNDSSGDNRGKFSDRRKRFTATRTNC